MSDYAQQFFAHRRSRAAKRPGRSKRPGRWLSALAAFAVAAIVFNIKGAAAADETVRPPNIVFILIDDLGWSDLGCYGNQFHETPHIDRLALEGVRFTDFYAAAPVCSATRASIFSGQYPARLALTDFVPGHWRPFEKLIVPEINDHLPHDVTTAAEILKQAGYATGYFGKWHLGNAPDQHPTHHGFDEAIVTGGRHFAPKFNTNPQTPVADGAALVEFLTDVTTTFIDEHKGEPFFVVLSHFAVHIPLEARAIAIEKYENKPRPDSADRVNHPVYAAMVESVDQSVGRVVRALDDAGVRDDTLIVFTSDNGGLRKIYTGAGELVTSNAPLRGEKGSLHEGGVRVPFIARWAGQIAPGGTCAAPTSTVDLLPTFAEVAAAEALVAEPCDGESMLPLFFDPEGDTPREPVFFHYPHYHHSRPAGAIRSGEWKLIEFFDDDSVELYDVKRDIGETRNVATDSPEVARRLREQLRAWRENIGARMPTKNPDHDPKRADEWWSRAPNKPIDREAASKHYRSPVAAKYQEHAFDANAPNVVLIISDDQAWTDFGFMGHPQIETPRLDRLARESLVFTRGYVPSSLCCPSLATMITGLYPHQNKISGNDPVYPDGARGFGQAIRDPAYRAKLDAMDAHMRRAKTLPRLLAERGYLSFQSGKWWHGGFADGGFTHGMTHGDTDRSGRHGDDGLMIGREGLAPIRDFLNVAEAEHKPFFIWYAPFLPHQPHNPPERLLKKYRDKTPSIHVAKYWAMCEWFDETCGQLLDLIAEKDATENTIVIFVTDNGWIQQPDAGGYAPRSKRSPYDGGIRTPIMIRWPGRVSAAKSDHLASSLDLAPTILRACGLESTAEMRGVDLLDEDAGTARENIFGEIFAHDEADVDDPSASLLYRWCIEGRWKLIVPHAPNVSSGAIELYDLIDDPHETQNLAAKEPDVVARLLREIDANWSPPSPAAPTSTATPSAAGP